MFDVGKEGTITIVQLQFLGSLLAYGSARIRRHEPHSPTRAIVFRPIAAYRDAVRTLKSAEHFYDPGGTPVRLLPTTAAAKPNHGVELLQKGLG